MKQATTLNSTDWAPDPEHKAETHWLPLVSELDEDGNYWWSATVKWDGCVNLHRFHNIPGNTPNRAENHMALDDYIHICDLDDLIEKLQKLKAEAIKHFGEGWPG